MKKRALHKDFRMELKKTFMRFLSILLIVALGVAFFSGLRACKEDMLQSASDYYDQTNFFDLSVIGTWGITSEDIKDIGAIDGVKDVAGVYSNEVIVKKDGQSFNVKTFSYHDKVNTYYMKDGRPPKDASECMADTLFLDNTGYQIGDRIQLSLDDENLSGDLNHIELTIVGSCYDPQYLSIFRGSGNTGNGSINSFLVMHESNYKSEVFTQAYITIDKNEEIGHFGKQYQTAVDQIKDKITGLSKVSCYSRYQEQVKEPRQALKNARADYEKQSKLLADETTKATVSLNEMDKKLREAESNLAITAATLETKRKKLSEVKYSEDDINTILAPYITQLNEKRALFEQSRQTYLTKKESFDNKQKETQEKLKQAQMNIALKEDALFALDEPVWYIGDRNWVESYVSFQQDTDRIDAIARVFPVIFFFVAALVCLTTMTRMVDEERTQIGVLKALGYRRLSIAGKFLKYAFIATVAGSIVGTLIGQKVFPYVVINAYRILYSGLPFIKADYQLSKALLAGILSIACTMLATYAACMKDLRSTPAQLMRPVAPKPGRRILLEHIPVLWNHLNFTRKSTLRNLFRYKKRFWMTTIGIAGCMGLIIVGFGIKDSIGIMGKLQFSQLWLQDAELTLKDNLDDKSLDDLMTKLKEKDEITDASLLYKKSVDGRKDAMSKNASLYLLKDDSSWNKYFVFRERSTKKTITISTDGVILTEKYARMLKVSVGDTITLSLSEYENVPVRVSGITENYLMHYIFMTEEYYNSLTGRVPVYNTCLLMTNLDDILQEESLLQQISDENKIVQGQYSTKSRQQRIDQMLESLNIITYVLIVSAGLLAFIVLYNLSYININERKRELASLKVLGFYDGEVNAYVMRENILLTILGIAAGIFLGKILHGFVIQTCEIDEVMFGRVIYPISYCYSALLTMGFSLLICMFMYIKLRKINMIESMKSVE